MIGYETALQMTLEYIRPLDQEVLSLVDVTDRVAAEDLGALVDSPSVDASLKDGYAIRADDITDATPENPVRLKLRGVIAAGMNSESVVEPGTTIRVLTGAKVPGGADAVVSEEFTIDYGTYIDVTRYAEPGRNIIASGSDISIGERVISVGTKLVPGKVGILAAAGYDKIPVFRRPCVGIIATGDEVVAPVEPLPEGKLFASNLLTLNAWCRRYGMKTEMDIVSDDADVIVEKLSFAIEAYDAVLTSGGAWTGDRDFVVRVLERLGWQQMFHRIRIGPGKAVGFGFIQGKPIFILPGGPPSNLMAFLQIALPGLMKLAGYKDPGLPRMIVKLSETVVGRQIDWTQFIFGRFEEKEKQTFFHPLKMLSRLQSMAKADGIIDIPEGVDQILAGALIPAQLLV
jgi:molybdopterin molybdotransferase